MSAPDYEALAKTMQGMADNLDDNAHTDPDLGVSDREDMIRDAALMDKVAAALRRAARIEAAARTRIAAADFPHSIWAPDGYDAAIERLALADIELREALEADAE